MQPKPPEQRRRRNRPEQWTILPEDGCSIVLPDWPLSRALAGERRLWEDLWRRPIAWWWHEQQISPYVVAHYVRSFWRDVSDPKAKLGPATSRMELALGLNPEALAKMRLVVGEPDIAGAAASGAAAKHYRHLRPVADPATG